MTTCHLNSQICVCLYIYIHIFACVNYNIIYTSYIIIYLTNYLQMPYTHKCGPKDGRWVRMQSAERLFLRWPLLTEACSAPLSWVDPCFPVVVSCITESQRSSSDSTGIVAPTKHMMKMTDRKLYSSVWRKYTADHLWSVTLLTFYSTTITSNFFLRKYHISHENVLIMIPGNICCGDRPSLLSSVVLFSVFQVFGNDACLKIAVTRGAVFARRSAVLLLFTSDLSTNSCAGRVIAKSIILRYLSVFFGRPNISVTHPTHSSCFNVFH
uniref:Secreted protein n=1 Tax=Heterorhabditis bacteriophora TaxID=37862 RepID=A0A1I7WHZ4_HETBA